MATAFLLPPSFVGAQPSEGKQEQDKEFKEFKNWPAGTSPQEIGKKVAEHFAAGPHTNFGRPLPLPYITYPDVVAWYGALNFAQVTSDRDLTARLIKRFDPLFDEESTLVPVPDHVDRTVFAIVPLEIYTESRDQKYLDFGKPCADKHTCSPRCSCRRIAQRVTPSTSIARRWK